MSFYHALCLARTYVSERRKHLEEEVVHARFRRDRFEEDISNIADIPVEVIEETEKILDLWVDEAEIAWGRAESDYERIKTLIALAQADASTEESTQASAETRDDASSDSAHEWVTQGAFEVRRRKK